jgi:hypothetical protein
MDMAGIGEKPITRSGPYLRTVWILAAAISSLTSSQVERTSPPSPRRDLYFRAIPVLDNGCPGLHRILVLLRLPPERSSAPRIMGYFSRLAL